jgi:hypothetical protein
MAITYTAIKKRELYFDPAHASGPWTIKCPLTPANGDWFVLVPINNSNTLITLDGNGKNIETFKTGASNATLSLDMAGTPRQYIFNSGRNTWNHLSPEFQDYGFKTSLTLGSGATTFAVNSPLISVTGHASGNTIATITGAFATAGSKIVIVFNDALIIVTDDNAHATNSVDLTGGNLTSADDMTLQLVHDGTSWYELSRSTN